MAMRMLDRIVSEKASWRAIDAEQKSANKRFIARYLLEPTPEILSQMSQRYSKNDHF